MTVVMVLSIIKDTAFPVKAYAVQIHGAPEGLIVHMMGHVFFFSALIFLLYILQRHPIDEGRAWRYLKISIFFWLAWNVDTFVVHWLSILLPTDALYKTSDIFHHRLNPPITWQRWVFYIGKFDHFLCVPAIYFLALSLKNFCQTAERRLKPEKDSPTR